MKNKFYTIFIVGVLVLFFSVVSAATRPSSDADMESLSYVFYLYYDNGQLFADRDYEVRYDVVGEAFVSPPSAPGNYRGEIINFKSETVREFEFNPRQGNPSLSVGKIQVRGPYVPNGQRASFYDSRGQQLVTIFINEVALCNDDNFCNSAEGENETVCPGDCVKATPRPTVAPPVFPEEGPDLTMILIYVVGGLGVAVGAWFGWKWWKKKKEESFLPPPSSPAPPGPTSPPPSPPLPIR